MATTSEQLAQAVSAINALQQTYSQEVGKWQTERTTMAALLANAITAVPNLRKVFFVDAVAGNDANEGTSAKPFATLDKALALAATIYAGSVDVFLRPGVYDVTVFRQYANIKLFIGGTTLEHVNNVVINWRSTSHDGVNAMFAMRYCTVNRHAVETAAHQKSVIKLTSGSAVFGGYVAGAISATNRAFHFISDGCPLFSTEAAGAFVSMEFTYAENTNAVSVSIAQNRSMMLMYKPVNTILSNFGTATTELKHARITE